MSPYDNAGRIHKQVFLVSLSDQFAANDANFCLQQVSNLVLFALCMVSVCARFYIRVVIQKQFSSDDGILLFGIACLIVAIGLLFTFIDKMYIVGAAESGNLVSVSLPADYIEQSFEFQKMVTVALVLTWCSIVSVKFSYLFLFRRLISRLPGMMVYWWIAAVYNGMISIYGAIVYGVACPEFYTLRACQYCSCQKGFVSTNRRSVQYDALSAQDCTEQLPFRRAKWCSISSVIFSVSGFVYVGFRI